MADITILNGVYKPTYNWGAPSCRNDTSYDGIDSILGMALTSTRRPLLDLLMMAREILMDLT